MRKRVDWYAASIFKWYLPGYVVFFTVPDLLFDVYPRIGWLGHSFMMVFLALMTGWMLFLFSILIDGNKLVIKRFGRQFEIERKDIGDWEALSWPPASRLHFTVSTPFGRSVLFMPRKLPFWTYGGENNDSYDMLADFKGPSSA